MMTTTQQYLQAAEIALLNPIPCPKVALVLVSLAWQQAKREQDYVVAGHCFRAIQYLKRAIPKEQDQ